MRGSLGWWRPRHLVGMWSAYWAALAAATLGPVVPIVWRVTRPGEHGTVGATVDDEGVRLTIQRGAETAWTGAAGLGEIALWLAVPPLLLWAVWLFSRPRTPPAVAPPAADPALHAGTPEYHAPRAAHAPTVREARDRDV